MMRLNPSRGLALLIMSCAGCTGVLAGADESNTQGAGAGASGGPGMAPTVPPGNVPGGSKAVPSTVLDSGRVVLRRLNRTGTTTPSATCSVARRAWLGRTVCRPRRLPTVVDTIGQNLVMSLLLAEQMDNPASTLVADLMAAPLTTHGSSNPQL